MIENETVVTESTEYVETTEPTETVPETLQTVLVQVDRPFMTTRFEEYTVLEGFQLLNFVLLLCCVFLALFRR